MTTNGLFSESSLGDRLDPAAHLWLVAPGVRTVLDALRPCGGITRFVGGAVRDALIGRPVNEVDFATTLQPEGVLDALQRAGLKGIPTGMAHGTITAVADGKGYEITTLRRDVRTFGRRAEVAFSDDWETDATRRDFTFNALYADEDGTIRDFTEGRRDLARGLVRFIGRAEDRVREDSLRLLRFFRFTAWLGQGEPDPEAVDACRRFSPLLGGLSRERVGHEILKLLAAPDPRSAWALMTACGATARILPVPPTEERWVRLVAAQLAADETFAGRGENLRRTGLLRLTALTPPTPESAQRVTEALRLSRAEGRLVESWGRLAAHLPSGHTAKVFQAALRQALYDEGEEVALGAALLRTAEEGLTLDEVGVREVINGWTSPMFPLNGEDMRKLGWEEGPEMGLVLRAVEAWWRARDFQPTREDCRAEACRFADKT